MSDELQIIQFESAAFCDGLCVFCPTGQGLVTRQRGTMTDETFHKIIDDGMKMGVRSYIPFLNGEPLLFRKLFDWLDYMQERDLVVGLFTNAGQLTKDKADRLASYKCINSVVISFHGGTPEAYECTMGLPFERTLAYVDYFRSVAPFPVTIYMLSFPDFTLGTEREFKQHFGKQAYISEAFFNWAGAITPPASVAAKQQPPKPCDRVLHHCTVLWDGRVCLCCMDYDGQVILGNVNEEPLQDIWNRNQPMRDRHKVYDFDMPLCRDCNLNRFGG